MLRARLSVISIIIASVCLSAQTAICLNGDEPKAVFLERTPGEGIYPHAAGIADTLYVLSIQGMNREI